ALVRDPHPGFLGRLELVADVDRRCGVVADEHDRERGRTAQLLADARDAGLELIANLLGDGLAVENLGGHQCSLPARGRGFSHTVSGPLKARFSTARSRPNKMPACVYARGMAQ